MKSHPRIIVLSHWPAFNLADVTITLGVLLLLLDSLWDRSGGSRLSIIHTGQFLYRWMLFKVYPLC